MDIETLKLANDYTDKHSGGSGGYGPDNVTVGLTVNNTLEVKDNSITDEKLKSLNELKTLIKNNFYDASKVAINILKYRITQLQFDDLINQVKSENIIADFCFETPWGDGNADPTIAQLKEKGVKYATTISEGYVNTFTFTNAFDNHKQRVKNLTTEISIILNEVSPFMSILDQIVYIHEWLCKHVKYDVENSKRYYNYNVYNCLVNKVSVCGGYSRVTELLFTLLGIPCSIVASTWAGHVWNIVQLDGHWYNFDATDDGFYPQVSFYENMLISTSVKYAMLQAEYLMESNDTVDIYTGLTPVSCTDTTYDNYWWRNVQGQLLFSHIYPNYWFYIDPTTNNIVDSLIDGTDKEVLYENTEYIEVDESTHITAFSYESILMHNLFILRGGLILRIGTDGLVEDSYSIPNSSEHIFKGIVLSEDCSSAHCFYVWDADDNTWNGVWYDTSETVNIAKVLNSSISESKLSLGVQEKLNNIINIKSFGAVGDGITNDTVAIQTAIDFAVSNKTGKVYFPNGIYAVKSLLFKSNIEYFGDGKSSVILAIAGTAVGETTVLIQSRTNILVHDLVFDGNKSVNTGGSDIDGIHLCDTFYTSHIIFDRVWFQNNVYSGTRYVAPSSGVSDANYLNCRFLNTDCGIIVLGSNDLTDFKVENCIVDGHSASEGIAVFHTGNGNNITIKNNTVRNKTSASGIYIGNKVSSTNILKNVIIDGNTVENTAAGITLRYCNGGKVVNNTVRNTVSGNGITIQDSSYVNVDNNFTDATYQWGMILRSLSNCIISNNFINNYNPANISGSYSGVWFDTVTDSIFEFNRITNTIASSTLFDIVFNKSSLTTGISSGLKIRNNYIGGKIYLIDISYLVNSDITLESYTEIFNSVINLTSNTVLYDKTATITLSTNTTIGNSGKLYQNNFMVVTTQAVTTTGFTHVGGKDGQFRTIWIPNLAYALTLASSATTVFTTGRTLAVGSYTLLKFVCRSGVWYEY